MPSSTVENYLKAIFKLTNEGEVEEGLAAIGKVAELLEVAPGTATTMMKQLVRLGFADYQPRKGVRLTSEGHSAVMNVLRRHRILELFLVENLNFDWSEVHEEAEVLEHAASDRLIDRIDIMLGLPTRDPHGDPIPDASGVMRRDDSNRLDAHESGHLRLVRVSRTTAEFLDWLSEVGLHPGIRFELISRDRMAGLCRIKIKDQPEELHFGQDVMENLWVVSLEN
jgi:DtxR family Mn-dependent transcriptional regulator